MFVQPSNLKSSSIETIKVDCLRNNVVVKFLNNVKHYIYQGVDVEDIVSYLHEELSAGEFVNEIKSKGCAFATF